MSTPVHVAVLMGGWSSEREVSLITGAGVADALERVGYRVTRIDMDRDVALRLAEANAGTIDLLLTDVVMPEMNGRQLADAAETHHQDPRRRVGGCRPRVGAEGLALGGAGALAATPQPGAQSDEGGDDEHADRGRDQHRLADRRRDDPFAQGLVQHDEGKFAARGQGIGSAARRRDDGAEVQGTGRRRREAAPVAGGRVHGVRRPAASRVRI